MASRNFANATRNFKMATRNISRLPFSDLIANVTWSTVIFCLMLLGQKQIPVQRT